MFIPGAFQLLAAIVKDEPHITERFRTGEGMGWHEHDHDLFEGTERFFRPGYLANLVDAWLPSLEGVVEKLRAGARVADIGCGHGASTILMAQAFPASTFAASDYHEGSIDAARRAAERAGVADRVTFEVASAKDFGGGPFDLVCVFDALHDMGDPVGAAAHVRSQLADDGTWMVVEPFAGRQHRGQPQPGRARVLRGLDDALHARVAEPGGRARARRPGRRGAARRGAARGRLQPRAADGRDAVQPGAGGASVAASVASERREALTTVALGVEPVRLGLGDLDVDADRACRRSAVGSRRHSKTRWLTRQEIVTRLPSARIACGIGKSG